MEIPEEQRKWTQRAGGVEVGKGILAKKPSRPNCRTRKDLIPRVINSNGPNIARRTLWYQSWESYVWELWY